MTFGVVSVNSLPTDFVMLNLFRNLTNLACLLHSCKTLKQVQHDSLHIYSDSKVTLKYNNESVNLLKIKKANGGENLGENPSQQKRAIRLLNGALGGIRTPDLLVRSQTLYPTGLQAHIVDLSDTIINVSTS